MDLAGQLAVPPQGAVGEGTEAREAEPLRRVQASPLASFVLWANTFPL